MGREGMMGRESEYGLLCWFRCLWAPPPALRCLPHFWADLCKLRSWMLLQRRWPSIGQITALGKSFRKGVGCKCGSCSWQTLAKSGHRSCHPGWGWGTNANPKPGQSPPSFQSLTWMAALQVQISYQLTGNDGPAPSSPSWHLVDSLEPESVTLQTLDLLSFPRLSSGTKFIPLSLEAISWLSFQCTVIPDTCSGAIRPSTWHGYLKKLSPAEDQLARLYQQQGCHGLPEVS